MTPLNPIYVRLFPSLARYVRRQWWFGMLGMVAILCALSFAGGVMIGSYRGRVADENYYEWGRRLNLLETDYYARFPGLRITKTQANDWAWEREKRRKEEEL